MELIKMKYLERTCSILESKFLLMTFEQKRKKEKKKKEKEEENSSQIKQLRRPDQLEATTLPSCTR